MEASESLIIVQICLLSFVPTYPTVFQAQGPKSQHVPDWTHPPSHPKSVLRTLPCLRTWHRLPHSHQARASFSLLYPSCHAFPWTLSPKDLSDLPVSPCPLPLTLVWITATAIRRDTPWMALPPSNPFSTLLPEELWKQFWSCHRPTSSGFLLFLRKKSKPFSMGSHTLHGLSPLTPA